MNANVTLTEAAGARAPRRVQRRRLRGWRMPTGAVYVGRPTRWGNPHTPESAAIVGPDGGWMPAPTRSLVRMFAYDLDHGHLPVTVADVRSELAGLDLVCWCPLDRPCHADVLLACARGDAPWTAAWKTGEAVA